MAEALKRLAYVYAQQKRVREAARTMRRATEIDIRNLGEDHPVVADDKRDLAVLGFKEKD